ncbi:MAG: MBL fold metallo-hydrolase [Erysipelotrichaceae bacterium]
MNYILLASGSKGNCFYLREKDTQIIIDCGTTYKYIKENLLEENINVKTIDGLFITHQHVDHIRCLNSFKDVKKYGVFSNESIERLQPYENYQFKDLTITPISLSHDKLDACGYIIESDNEKLVYITDTGYLNQKNIECIKDANYYIFESNHDPLMLMQTERPHYVKKRIVSDEGHLSNEQCSNYLCKVVGDNTKEITLAHISEQGNTQKLAYNYLLNEFNNKGIDVNKINIQVGKQFGKICGGKR